MGCGDNSSIMTPEGFLAGCNRFGIDNPCPIISKRMSLYGINEDLEKDFKRLVDKYKKDYPGIDIDPDVYGSQAPAYDKMMLKPVIYDFKETKIKSPLKKSSGIFNMQILS
jgi:hypothetical protein